MEELTYYPEARDLLSRDSWRTAVLARERGRCAICGGPAAVAHHILERHLFDDGGYYLDNGVALCETADGGCHRRAERSELSCAELRAAAGITRALYPLSLARDEAVDRWGNVVDADGLVHPGPLFESPGSQRALGVRPVSRREKYPRTPHLPWSPALGAGERVSDLSGLMGETVVASVKMDGENTTIGRDETGVYCHARSLDSTGGATRSRVRALAAEVGPQLPLGWRVIGENLQSRHSVGYRDLPDAFLVIAVVDADRRFLSMAETDEWAGLLGLSRVPELWCGPFDERRLRRLEVVDPYSDEPEGYVVRVAGDFSTAEFGRRVAKWVRADLVTGSRHWRHRKHEENRLA